MAAGLAETAAQHGLARLLNLQLGRINTSEIKASCLFAHLKDKIRCQNIPVFVLSSIHYPEAQGDHDNLPSCFEAACKWFGVSRHWNAANEIVLFACWKLRFKNKILWWLSQLLHRKKLLFGQFIYHYWCLKKRGGAVGDLLPYIFAWDMQHRVRHFETAQTPETRVTTVMSQWSKIMKPY